MLTGALIVGTRLAAPEAGLILSLFIFIITRGGNNYPYLFDTPDRDAIRRGFPGNKAILISKIKLQGRS